MVFCDGEHYDIQLDSRTGAKTHNMDMKDTEKTDSFICRVLKALHLWIKTGVEGGGRKELSHLLRGNARVVWPLCNSSSHGRQEG